MGGFYVLQEAINELDLKASKLKVAIQGFGNAGSVAAKLLYDAGYKVVALADSRVIIFDKKGFDVDKVIEHKEKIKTLAGFKGSKEIDIKEFFALDVDVLVPAALENQITKSNASDIKAKIILELANGPTTPEADEILFENNVMVIPDVLANAGGVTVSYFEWIQNNENNYWSDKEVDDELKERMIPAWQSVLKNSKEYKIDLRTAAFVTALKRLAEAIKVQH